MATTVVPTSFKVLVKMVASAFYGGLCPPLEAIPADERERALKPQVRLFCCSLPPQTLPVINAPTDYN
jgi:hypothetical protein